jgi:hypothetical protein
VFGYDGRIPQSASCRSLNEEDLAIDRTVSRIMGEPANSHSCTTTGTLSPGFNFGRPRVVTTTLPHSPEGGNPPI